jgi:FtsZ-binding cell division protein ZapB
LIPSAANGGNGDNNTLSNVGLSINASGHILCAEVNISSDLRVKKDLQVSNGVADLEALLGIQITNYRFKDSMHLGSGPYKKVLAQQVESVYPQAVTKGRGEIPDIYQNASVRDGWVEIDSDLKMGELVKLIGPKGESVVAVLEVKPGAFRPDLKLDGDKVFVYGRQVEDFRRVDYDAIAMLNVSATQQIKREKDAEIQALRAENSELREQLDALRITTAALQERDDVWESRMLAIERSLEGGQASPKTVPIKAANLAR